MIDYNKITSIHYIKKLSLWQFLYKLSALFITLLSIFYFVKAVMRHFNEIPDLTWGVLSILVAITCVSFVVINIGLGAVIWLILLIDIGASVNWRDIMVVFLITQFAKYLPGNVGHHVGRIFMAREIGISTPITLSTMLIETLWVISTAAGLTVLSLFLFVDEQTVGLYRQIGPISLSIFVGILFFMPWLLISFFNRFLPNFLKRLTEGKGISPPKLRTTLSVSFLFCLSFLLMGLILKLQSQYFLGANTGNLFQLTCLFAVAWLAGYLSPGSPGGLGIREAMMVILLSPLFGEGTAVGLGITLRVTTTVGDAVAFGVGLAMHKITKKIQYNSL